MNSSEKLRPLSLRPLAKFNPAAAFCDTHVHGGSCRRSIRDYPGINGKEVEQACAASSRLNIHSMALRKSTCGYQRSG
jgi:hypothetical protein